MYGTRPAAEGWHGELSFTLEEIGLKRGISSAGVFANKAKQLVCTVHGDDFTTAGPKKSLDWLKKELERHYELKEAARLGGGAKDDKEARVLN